MEKYTDFKVAYATYYKRVFSFIMIRTNNNREVSEEIANDVFVKVAEFMDIFDPEKAKFLTWLLNITKNKIVDHYRFLNTYQKKREVCISDFCDESGKEFMQVIASEDSESIENVELRSKIDKAFDILKDMEKEVADLYIKQDKQYKEIAEMLSIPIGSVKGYLNRARMKIQIYLKDVYVN